MGPLSAIKKEKAEPQLALSTRMLAWVTRSYQGLVNRDTWIQSTLPSCRSLGLINSIVQSGFQTGHSVELLVEVHWRT